MCFSPSPRPSFLLKYLTLTSAALLALLTLGVAPGRAELLFSVTHGNSRINALDADTGALLYSFIPPQIPQLGGGNGLAYSGSVLYYTTIETATIFALDPTTGAILARLNRAPGAGQIDALGYGTTMFGDTLFSLDYTANRLFLQNPTSGVLLASYVVGFDAIGGIDFNHARGTLYVSDALGMIRELNPNTGAVLNSFPTGGLFQTGLGLVGDRLFTSAQADSLIVERDPLTGAVLRTFVSPGGSAGALAGGPGDPVIPEPASLVLAGVGGLCVLAWRRRRKDAQAGP